ncbi:MAG: hypothetical protein J2P54_00125 [Bradyrhizobiaceae bacterium]|nr:hypothetical protein [Bradyrhizobiaceae bacterium]
MSASSPPGIARFDSAAAMVQAIGAFLNDHDVTTLSGSPLLDRAMPAINRLPQRMRERVYSIGGMTEAVSHAALDTLDYDAITGWIAGLLPRRTYPAAFVGSSNGALVHLAAAIGAPWLPQTFLCPVRGMGSDPDDALTEFTRGRAVTRSILAAQPEVSVHHMLDPNQDRLMLKMMSYFRLKYRRLPRAYRDFLIRCLPRGGTLYIDECTLRWPVTRTSDRSVFQFGAVGGLEPEEYLRGSGRVRNYLARYNVNRTAWDPPLPDDTAPEAEWGFEPALLEEVASLACAKGWRLMKIEFENPEALSLLAASIYMAWYRELGHEPTRLLVDSFVLLDPYRTIRLRAVPFWLLFCVERSATVLEQFLDRRPPFDEIGMMLFSHGTDSVGVASIDRWRRLLARARRSGYFIGVDEHRYPRDFATFTRFHYDLAKLGLPFDVPAPMSPDQFDQLACGLGPGLGVRIGAYAHRQYAAPAQ